MAKQEFSIPALTERLVTEADAYLLLEELRWGGQPDALLALRPGEAPVDDGDRGDQATSQAQDDPR